MSKIIKPNFKRAESDNKFNSSRRRFLAYSSITLTASGLLLIGCKDDDPMPMAELKAPSGLAADNATEGQITLSWTDNSEDEDGFKIERSTTMNSGFAEVGSVGKDVTTYTDMDVDPATTYYYRIKATKGTMASAYSSVVSSMTGEIVANFGTGDIGILNYAYALEQLEAAFYTQVVDGAYYEGAPENEKAIMMDLMKHEVAHREFFKAALGDAAIPSLTVDFSDIDFASRDSVLTYAKTFEDLGVSAYNGAGQFIENVDYLVIAGKIVSVEARHASAIRDLINPNAMDFAGDDIINANGLEVTRSFSQILEAAAPFITTQLDVSGLPTETGYQVTV